MPHRRWRPFTAQNASECVELLLQSGADVTVVNRMGQTADEIASKCKHERIFGLINAAIDARGVREQMTENRKAAAERKEVTLCSSHRSHTETIPDTCRQPLAHSHTRTRALSAGAPRCAVHASGLSSASAGTTDS